MMAVFIYAHCTTCPSVPGILKTYWFIKSRYAGGYSIKTLHVFVFTVIPTKIGIIFSY